LVLWVLWVLWVLCDLGPLGPLGPFLQKNFFEENKNISGLESAVANNLDHILENLTYNRNSQPFVRIVLTLSDTGLNYVPAVSNQPTPGTLLERILNALADIFNVGTLIPRLAVDRAGTTFQSDMEKTDMLQQMREEIGRRVVSVNPRLLQFQENFEKYNSIWTINKSAQLQTFFVQNSSILDDAKLALYGIPKLLDVLKIEDQVR
jgi:hypothetical protein